MGEHGEGDVPVPAAILPYLVVVESGFAFGGLEGFLDGPAGPGDTGQLGAVAPGSLDWMWHSEMAPVLKFVAWRFLAIVATHGQMWASSLSLSKCVCDGSQLRDSRGRALILAATSAKRSGLWRFRLVPLGKYWRMSPLVFSLEPRCHGECASQK